MKTRSSSRASGRWLDLLLVGLTAALTAGYGYRLVVAARHGSFSTDECFHAYAAEWILAHHRLPEVMPELYSGFPYYYQPLLHVVGAAWLALFGPIGLHLLPVAFSILTLGLLLLTPGLMSARARAWATLLCLTNVSLAQYAVRLFVEGLTTLLVLGAVLLVLAFHRTRRMSLAWALGVVCGLTLLTKIHGWLLIVLLGVLVVTYRMRQDPRRGNGLACAILVAVAMAAPWLVRNQILFGSPIYPALGPDIDRGLLALNQKKFGLPFLAFLAGIPTLLGVPIAAAAATAAALAAWRRRWDLHAGLLAAVLAGMIAMGAVPLIQHRHLNWTIPLLALLSAGILLESAARHRWGVRAVDAVLLVIATVAVLRMPNYRLGADLPGELRDACREIAGIVPEGETILSLWTYDTFYYTRRPATWPIPWGQHVPLAAIFYERDPDRFKHGLDRCGIDYLLVPRFIRPVPFDGDNYPESFMNCVVALQEHGRLEVVWYGGKLLLLKNPVP